MALGGLEPAIDLFLIINFPVLDDLFFFLSLPFIHVSVLSLLQKGFTVVFEHLRVILLDISSFFVKAGLC